MDCLGGDQDMNMSHITVETADMTSGGEPLATTPTKERNESLIQWFDRTCEKELNKRRQSDAFSPTIDIIGQQGLGHPNIVRSSTSGIDIASRMRSEQDTDLLEAVDKFAKAEAMVAFEGAVRAAENAAASVSPEYAEEAAVAGARTFQAELTSVVKETVPGIRPVEVVGYVGITKPRRPKKP
ncbi:hypothetical protein QE152_g19024 [Popillia japonica]|uniref:Uncharacterized protein n=1 Tax=Popillia japonica TaxID=7064 RepID=A0AAW1L3Q0_POPJA